MSSEPTTEAGKRLADADWNSADIWTAILAIEAEAKAQERERLKKRLLEALAATPTDPDGYLRFKDGRELGAWFGSVIREATDDR